MTRYLLDTTVLIDFSKGFDPATAQLLAWIDAGETIGVCAIVVAEFCAGLPVATLRRWAPFLSSLTYWNISSQAAIHAGQDKYHFARQGKTLTITDALVAAVAREQGAVVATSNVKNYPMADIQIFPLLSTAR